MEILACLAAGVAFAFFNRLRGGLFGDDIRRVLGGGRVAAVVWGTNGARLLAWGVPFGLAGWLCGEPAWLAAGVGVLAWVGCMVGQGGGLSMGHNPNGAQGLAAWAGMLEWGVARTWPAAIVLAMASGHVNLMALPLALCGLLCPAIYFAAWYVPAGWYRPGMGYGMGPGAYDPPELAEVAHGAAIGVCLVLAAWVA